LETRERQSKGRPQYLKTNAEAETDELLKNIAVIEALAAEAPGQFKASKTSSPRFMR